jgi:hypothetical protein
MRGRDGTGRTYIIPARQLIKFGPPPRRARLEAEFELQRLGPAGELLVRVGVRSRHVVGVVAELRQRGHEGERPRAGPAEAQELHGELALQWSIDEVDFARVGRGTAREGAEGGGDEGDVAAADGGVFGCHFFLIIDG